uniref:Uncharacterized protein n=1 Tax=Knipowitschia caucasica TaxID=637954 RepID=A0AAV2M0P7_KNICA
MPGASPLGWHKHLLESAQGNAGAAAAAVEVGAERQVWWFVTVSHNSNCLHTNSNCLHTNSNCLHTNSNCLHTNSNCLHTNSNCLHTNSNCLHTNSNWLHTNSNCLHTNSNCLHTNSNWLHTNSNWLHTNSNCLHTNSNWLHTNSNCLHTNSNWLHTNSNWLHTNSNCLHTNSNCLHTNSNCLHTNTGGPWGPQQLEEASGLVSLHRLLLPAEAPGMSWLCGDSASPNTVRVHRSVWLIDPALRVRVRQLLCLADAAHAVDKWMILDDSQMSGVLKSPS